MICTTMGEGGGEEEEAENHGNLKLQPGRDFNSHNWVFERSIRVGISLLMETKGWEIDI